MYLGRLGFGRPARMRAIPLVARGRGVAALYVDGGVSDRPVNIEALEMLGAERLVYGQVGGVLFTIRVDATEKPPKAGDVVSLQAAPAHLHWFDAATQQRL